MEEISYATNLLSMLGEWENIEALLQSSIGGQLRLLDAEGGILAGSQTLPPFCALVRSSELGISRCRKSYADIYSQEKCLQEKMGVFRCHAGLSNFFFPIAYENRALGAIAGGAVFGDESRMSQASELLRELQLDGKESTAKLKQVAHVPEGELRGVARIMRDVTGPFIANLLQHEHLAQLEKQMRSQIYQGSDIFVLDEVTGVFNPHYLTNRLDKEISRARRYQETLSLLVLDIENLPDINREYGHEMGDVVLREIAGILQHHARESETVARLSGTGFGVIFPRTTQKEAEKPLLRLRKIIAKHPYQLGKDSLPIAPLVKMGVAEYSPQIQGGEELLARARTNLS